MGLEGRRWFGCDNCWSLYARSNFALVLGQFDIDQSATNSQSSTGTFVHQSYHDSHDRVIPMTEIELGATWQINCRWNFSAGYDWQAWWDLGMFEQGANTFQEPIDTSNILSLDGLFAPPGIPVLSRPTQRQSDLHFTSPGVATPGLFYCAYPHR